MATAWQRLIGPAQRRFRHQRAQRIKEQLPQIEQGRVIDIGGSLTFWREVGDTLMPAKVICYNLSEGRMLMGVDAAHSVVTAKLYDGVRIPEDDGSADVVICNSVIEHVPPEARQRLADEVVRVGRSWVVQTPSPWFPLELHFGLPFIHWLPRAWGRVLVRLSPFHWLSGADGPTYFDETRLLSRRELMGMFPTGHLVVERALGIPKSYLVFGGPNFGQPLASEANAAKAKEGTR